MQKWIELCPTESTLYLCWISFLCYCWVKLPFVMGYVVHKCLISSHIPLPKTIWLISGLVQKILPLTHTGYVTMSKSLNFSVLQTTHSKTTISVGRKFPHWKFPPTPMKSQDWLKKEYKLRKFVCINCFVKRVGGMIIHLLKNWGWRIPPSSLERDNCSSPPPSTEIALGARIPSYDSKGFLHAAISKPFTL